MTLDGEPLVHTRSQSFSSLVSVGERGDDIQHPAAGGGNEEFAACAREAVGPRFSKRCEMLGCKTGDASDGHGRYS